MTSLRTWDVYLIGTLPSNEYVQQKIGRDKGIFINSQNVIQSVLKVVSKEPDHLPKERLFTCFSHDLEPFGFIDNSMEADAVREERLIQFLNDYLVVFNPSRKITASRNEVYQARDIQLIRKSDRYKEDDWFMPIPIFSKKKNGLSFEEFTTRLLNQRHVGKVPFVSTEPNDTPDIILWKDDDGSLTVFGTFHSHSYAYGGFCFMADDSLYVKPFPDDWMDDVYEVDESILFIPDGRYEDLLLLLKGEGASMHTSGNQSESAGEVAAAIMEVVRPNEIAEDGKSPIDYEQEELKFLDHFIQLTKENGLYYEAKDLVNFHTAMKTSNLVILQGMSGIGKTRLVSSYARALNIHNDRQFTIIPVRPAWGDDADLIGYVDAMNHLFRPGDSGLVDAIIRAAKEPDHLFMVVFEEMNLARVEHYFSQFLSVLELDADRRIIGLYNDHLESGLKNANQYPAKIPIGSNMMFVGTVNMDESTYHFSDKVLDRANVINLHVLPFTRLRERTNVRTLTSKMSYPLFHSFKKQEETLQLSEREAECLWELHLQMQEAGRYLGIGPRVVRQIDRYLQNLVPSPYLSRREAFDLQMVQRVLTKIRGSEELLHPVIGSLHPESNEVVGGSFLSVLKRFEDISDFTETKKVLRQKAKELKMNGFTF
ncbi:McrB family protein [Fictibacillus gelatini]|uniref:McrB family protein n=1 Tax=Fictibacillus gelatini TaxID=225985 RepID=UPI000401BCC5|nr:AAA family ATPase [Fictibacillus gelatini]